MRQAALDRDSVPTTDSGLQYEALNDGAGQKARLGDIVEIFVEGSLPDGRVFYNSGTVPRRIELGDGTLVPGLDEGLQLMTAGSSYRFVVPPALAYGHAGAGESVPPGSTVIFDVELLITPSTGGEAGLMVKFDTGVSPEEAACGIEAAGGRVNTFIESTDVYSACFPSEASRDEAVETLRARPDIVYVELNQAVVGSGQ